MKENKTNWSKVRAAQQADEPIVFDPETDPYDPNDEAAVRAYWKGVNVGRKLNIPIKESIWEWFWKPVFLVGCLFVIVATLTKLLI